MDSQTSEPRTSTERKCMESVICVVCAWSLYPKQMSAPFVFTLLSFSLIERGLLQSTSSFASLL